MHIVFAASECVPYAKTGGLADVVGALPSAVAKLGHKVTVYIPLYRQVQKHLTERRVAIPSLTIPFVYYNRFVTVVDGGEHDGVQHYFIDCPELFDREFLYGTSAGDYPDNAERFGLFARAVLESTKQLGVPDVFHVHDWQSSMLPVYLRTTYYFDPALSRSGCLLTIHNAAYQGAFPPATTEELLLPWDVFTMDRVEQYNNFNFLKGGIVYSDIITTVSRRYAEEIQTPEFGNQLDPILRKRSADLHGILNGVDYAQWDPATDGNIAGHYTARNLKGKQECRRDVLHAFGAKQVGDQTPVIGIVSRFATQKGFDLIEQAAAEIFSEDLFVVALGTGEPYYENLFKDLQQRYPEKFSVKVMYDEALAHKVEAGSDMFLMPSRYEPCGLNQIYSLRYGAVPVVRATGGLDDTIQEWDAEHGTGTGFKFEDYDPAGFLAALRRALAAFKNKKGWQKLMRNGMVQNYSWEKPSQEYVACYEEVARRRS
ncbi:MAG TPA: glycogen synthase GlgA [Acidisarcina sp.]|nr:glycogen synthase GlgA [Acidisarcina sp.]